jgi:hypothetical protein
MEQRFIEKLNGLTNTLDRFLKRLTDTEEEFHLHETRCESDQRRSPRKARRRPRLIEALLNSKAIGPLTAVFFHLTVTPVPGEYTLAL